MIQNALKWFKNDPKWLVRKKCKNETFLGHFQTLWKFSSHFFVFLSFCLGWQQFFARKLRPFCSPISYMINLKGKKWTSNCCLKKIWKSNLSHNRGQHGCCDNGWCPSQYHQHGWCPSAKLFKKCIGNTRFQPWWMAGTAPLDGVINRNVQPLVTFLAFTNRSCHVTQCAIFLKNDNLAQLAKLRAKRGIFLLSYRMIRNY